MKKKLPTKKAKKLTINSIVSRPRRAAFASNDAAYLSTNPSIRPKDYIDAGSYGAVYTIDGNENMVIKMPIGAANRRCEKNKVYCENGNCYARDDILKEGLAYEDLGLEKKEHFIPTKRISLGKCGVTGESCVGLVRPKVKMTIGDKAQKPTRSQLERIRRNVIDISRDGITLMDNLQIGIDAQGRPLQFDIGLVHKFTPEEAFDLNNDAWVHYLLRINGLDNQSTPLNRARMLREYGSINPRR